MEAGSEAGRKSCLNRTLHDGKLPSRFQQPPNELGMIVRVDFVEMVDVDDDDFLRVIIQKAVDLVEGLFCRLG